MRAAARGLAFVIIALVAGAAWGQASLPVGELLQMLRGGGYVIVFRHGATHPDQADTDPLNPGNVAKQRQLNDKGRADAKAVGEALKAAALLGATPDGGTNTLIVTHKPNILDALGKDWFDVGEGEASIFKPEGGGKYSLVTRVQIGQWVTAKR